MRTTPYSSLDVRNDSPGTATTTSRHKPSSSPAVSRLMQVTWEITRDHERKAGAPRRRTSGVGEGQQLSTAEAFHLVDEVTAMHVPLLAITGGDPLSRLDLFPVIEYAARRSVRASLTLLPTSSLNAALIGDLKQCGLMRIAFWLHGSTATLHDGHWGISGSYRRTLEIIRSCHELQLPVQINTVIGRSNIQDIDAMIELLTHLDIGLWNVFFLVPANEEQKGEVLGAKEHEMIFAKLYAASERVHFQIKTTEGQHYQRYVLQQLARESRGRMTEEEVIDRASKSVSDGKRCVFVNHRGEVYPSRFLPVSAGNITDHRLCEIYESSSLFVDLRDSAKLKGKCGRCSYRNVCGGSRARAFAMTGDLFAEEPCCAYQPPIF